VSALREIRHAQALALAKCMQIVQERFEAACLLHVRSDLR
jgi:hypothetical protein